jgi:CHAT domain-containing protein
MVHHRDQLWAVTLVEGRLRLHRLGAPTEVAAEIDALCFALRRLTRDRGPAASRRAASASASFAADRLDGLLFAPVAAAVGDRSLVLVPIGGMHVVPWSALSSLRGRPVSVAPSADLWLRTTTTKAASQARRKVLVAGPGLASAGPEIEELAGAYPEATVLEGATATASNVAAALDGAGLAHVAAHGTFRSDNPLFSSLRLADGPLTVHDLEGLRATPRCLVLSACDTGLSAVHPGDELMGMSSAVLGLGSTNVVASVVPVPDATARVVMVDFHRRMRAGALAPQALAEAVEANPPPDAMATGFVCFGG